MYTDITYSTSCILSCSSAAGTSPCTPVGKITANSGKHDLSALQIAQIQPCAAAESSSMCSWDSTTTPTACPSALCAQTSTYSSNGCCKHRLQLVARCDAYAINYVCLTLDLSFLTSSSMDCMF